MTVCACFDESGKFKDHKVICIGSVTGFAERFERDFSPEWGTLLKANGLKVLSGKDVLNYNKPLSEKNPCIGIEARAALLRSFVSCIRKNLQAITGLAVDAEAFKKLPPHFFQVFGNNPSFMAFARNAMHVLDFVPDRNKLSLICDEDEETAMPFYRLYKRLKRVWPDARRKFGGISFVDDRYVYGVQASDLVASLMRLEAHSQITGEMYDYKHVFDALTEQPKPHERWLFNVAISVARENNLKETAEGVRSNYEKAFKDNEEKQKRVRELRSNNAQASRGSARPTKGQARRGKVSKRVEA